LLHHELNQLASFSIERRAIMVLAGGLRRYSKRHPERAFSMGTRFWSEIDHIVTAITSNRTFCDGRHIETALFVMGITCTDHCEGSRTAASCLV
jgi:hypothetical protein